MLAILADLFLSFNGALALGALAIVVCLVFLRVSYLAVCRSVRLEQELCANLLLGVQYILFVDLIVVGFCWLMTMDWIDVYWSVFTVIGESIYYRQYFYLDVPELPFNLFFNGYFILDNFSLFFKFLAFLVLVFVCHYVSYSVETYRFYVAPEVSIFLLLAAFGAYGVFHSSHWFLLCVYFEILALSLVVLPYLANRYSNIAIEGALIFLVISFIASIAFFICGLSFFYVSGGEPMLGLQLRGFFPLLATSGGSLFIYSCGCFFLNCCFFIKLTLWPWHSWVRNLYEALSWDIVALYAALSKLVAAYLLIILNSPFQHYGFSGSYSWMAFTVLIFWPFYFFGLLSAYYGALAPLFDTRLSRLLAFSGIAFAGQFVLLLSTATRYGLTLSVYFLCLYVINILGILGFFNFFWRLVRRVTDISGLLQSTNGALVLLSTIMLLNFGGLPPLLMFFGKLIMIGTLQSFCGPLVAFNLLLANTLGMVIYIRLMRFLWFSFPQQSGIVFAVLFLSKRRFYLFVMLILCVLVINGLFMMAFADVFSFLLLVSRW